jgi:hypothetical protein
MMRTVELIFTEYISLDDIIEKLGTIGTIHENEDHVLYLEEGECHLYISYDADPFLCMEQSEIDSIANKIVNPIFYQIDLSDCDLAWRAIQKLAETREFYLCNDADWFASLAEYSSWVDWCEIFGEDWVRSKPASDSDGIFLVPPSRVETDISDAPPP